MYGPFLDMFFITSNLAGNFVLSVFGRCIAPNTKVVVYGIHAKSYAHGFDHQLWPEERTNKGGFVL